MEYMQDMTNTICASQTTPAAEATDVPTKTLTDSRDGNTYTIAKLKDGNCWMTQNLRALSMLLTSDNSDVVENYYIPASVSLDKSNDTPRYFNIGDTYQSRVYYSENSTNNRNYGAYYSWMAATAGTGISSVKDGNAPSSICPKGWKLPSGGNKAGQLYDLLSNLAVEQITTSPYYFTYAGDVSSSDLINVGKSGLYWSSTAKDAAQAYYLFFNTSVILSDISNRYNGLSVRCVDR